jgi:hypothetical protein
VKSYFRSHTIKAFRFVLALRNSPRARLWLCLYQARRSSAWKEAMQ